MVGFDPKSKTPLTNLDYSIAGASTGCITRFLFQPLDVLKIRFQLQIEPIKHSSNLSKYKGIMHAVNCMVKEETIKSLWKGHIPAQYLSFTYGIVQFTTFEYLTKAAWNYFPPSWSTDHRARIDVFCGSTAGSLATVACQPFDVIRTRLVGQGEPKVYTSIYNAAKTMMAKEGLTSFYKGLGPTLLQIAPNAGAQFAFYRFFKDVWREAFKLKSAETGALESTICGAAAGVAAKTTVYPLDLIKKRFQVHGFEEARKKFGAVRYYSSIKHCFVTVFKEEGFLGLYKGLLPSVWKAAFTTGSHFFFYEQMCQLLILRHKKEKTL